MRAEVLADALRGMKIKKEGYHSGSQIGNADTLSYCGH